MAQLGVALPAAAVTTSLPEQCRCSRNWDYRYVWLRDALLTIEALLAHGYAGKVAAWRGWLLRAIAGGPSDVQIMYGLSGERRLSGWIVDALPGYEEPAPVRVGDNVYLQYQGDIFGEVMFALRRHGKPASRSRVSAVQHFTHSTVMLWVALDCGIRGVRDFGLHGPVERWELLRDTLREEIEECGFDPKLGAYTQHHGSGTIDASLLLLAQFDYLRPDDPRMLGTVAALEAELRRDGLLLRDRTETGVDGLPADGHPFLAFSLWLVERYARSGWCARPTRSPRRTERTHPRKWGI